jgi:hypothetical protein
MIPKGTKSRKKPQPKPELLSISQLAARFELDRATVRKRLDAAGITPVSEKAKEKLFDVAIAQEVIEIQADATYEKARARKIALEAELKELDLQRERGELVAIRDVREDLQKIFQRLFQRIAVQSPKELAGALFKAESAAQVEDILRKHNGKIFSDIRRDHQAYLNTSSHL